MDGSVVAGSDRRGAETITTEENPKLYEVAKQTAHEFGMPWTDPRTGETFPSPKMRAILDREETLGRCEMEIANYDCNAIVCNDLAAVCDTITERTYCMKCFKEYCR